MKTKITGLAALTASALIAGSFAASASVIFSDSFENPQPSNNWYVYQNVENWIADPDTAGIEIQRNGTLSGVSAFDGVQYVELDSDRRRGGNNEPTNSAMTKTVQLNPGRYELSWYYKPRTGTAGDNLIEVFLAGDSDGLFDTIIASESGTAPADWKKVVSTFTITSPTDNPYAISFRAGGKQNTLGGFIDKVTLAAVPLPAGILLLGLGLAGIGGARVMQTRRKSG